MTRENLHMRVVPTPTHRDCQKVWEMAEKLGWDVSANIRSYDYPYMHFDASVPYLMHSQETCEDIGYTILPLEKLFGQPKKLLL